MEPQDNSLNKSNIPTDQQNPANWWQTPVPVANLPLNNGQPVPVAADIRGANPAQPKPATPQVAGDTDMIEPEWVGAVKKIMDEYKTDPYSETQALTLLRADYLKKRYNKDIKTPEN
jgi:hypothetical protein